MWRKLTNVEQDDVFALFVFNGIDDAVREIENFQNALLRLNVIKRCLRCVRARFARLATDPHPP